MVRQPIIAGEEVVCPDSRGVVNPSRGEMFEEVGWCGREHAKAAVDAAEEAFDELSSLPLSRRRRIIVRIADLLESKLEEFAKTLALEAGKPLKDARIEVVRAISVFRIAAEEASTILEGHLHRIDAYEYPAGNDARLLLERREPLGVVVAILPYNFPVNSMAHKIAPNIAVGNTVVVKPAPETPITPMMFTSLIHEAGIPKGSINVVTGPEEIVGWELVSSRKVDGLTFTGSTRTGTIIASEAVKTGKKVMMEMGGSDPMIIVGDADVGDAVETAVRARFEYAGQNCNSTKRILVHERISDMFSERFTKAASQLRVGDALEEGVEMGPVISEERVTEMGEFVEDAVSRGAILSTGGKRMRRPGFYFQPTVLVRVPADARSMREEVFGPVASIYVFSSEEEAVSVANSTSYGLQASVFSRDLKRAMRIARRLEAGAVMINESTRLRWDALPFGGVKLSGLGAREGVRTTMLAMSEPKLVSFRI